jgi:hypothetical protein
VRALLEARLINEDEEVVEKDCGGRSKRVGSGKGFSVWN